MTIACVKKGCRGRISTGRRGRQRYYEGDAYSCPKCGQRYTIGCTDDYEDDCAAYLIPEGLEGLERSGNLGSATSAAWEFLNGKPEGA